MRISIQALLVVIAVIFSVPAYAEFNEYTARDCDQFAGSPRDPQKAHRGIIFSALNPDIAIPMCQEATAAYPNNARLWFQLGRAYEKQNNLNQAIAAYERAAKLGSAAAYNNLGELYKQGKGYPKDLSKATELFKKSSELGSSEGRENLIALTSPTGSLPSVNIKPEIKSESTQSQSQDDSKSLQNATPVSIEKESQNSIFLASYFVNIILCGILLCLCILIYLVAKVLPRYLQVKENHSEEPIKPLPKQASQEENVEALSKLDESDSSSNKVLNEAASIEIPIISKNVELTATDLEMPKAVQQSSRTQEAFKSDRKLPVPNIKNIQIGSVLLLFVALVVISKFKGLDLFTSPFLAALSLINFFCISKYAPKKYNETLAISLFVNILTASLIVQYGLDQMHSGVSLIGNIWFWVGTISITIGTYFFAKVSTFILFCAILNAIIFSSFINTGVGNNPVISLVISVVATYFLRKHIPKLAIGLMAGISLGTTVLISLEIAALQFFAKHVLEVISMSYILSIGLGIYLQYSQRSTIGMNDMAPSKVDLDTKSFEGLVSQNPEKIVEKFDTLSGIKGGLKDFSVASIIKTKQIVEDLNSEVKKINQIKNETIISGVEGVAKKDQIINFWSQLSQKQKFLILGFISSIFLCLFYLISSSAPTNKTESVKSNFRQGVGFELVCVGRQPRSALNIINVDCSNRQSVVQALEDSWLLLRSKSIGGTFEDLCWEPYNRAKEIPPTLSMVNIAPTFFMQCNMALQYAK